MDSGWPLCSLCLCGLILLLISGTADAWPIALPNAGFEQIDPHGIPVGWQHVTFWSDSNFHLETANPHSGHYAIRIDGAPHAQGYLRLRDAIEVSPGEVLEAGAWVKLRDVPPNQMATIAAEFTNTDGQSNDFARFVNIPRQFLRKPRLDLRPWHDQSPTHGREHAASVSVFGMGKAASGSTTCNCFRIQPSGAGLICPGGSSRQR